MFDHPADGLRKATALTAAGRLMDATAVIQRVLNGGSRSPDGAACENSEPADCGRRAGPLNMPAALGDAMRQRMHGLRARLPGGAAVRQHTGRPPATPAMPEGAQFLHRNFTGDAGSRPYKLYVPAGYSMRSPVPLIVMLHGCTQTPDDFAAGTRMNQLAEAHGFLVAYPAQTRSANMQKCWNWFNAADQVRGEGEPALIAGITRQVMTEYAVDASRVFVAGLSAGGAAAAIMGHAYPDLYAAIGVHSGLACGAARDMPSAFAAMRQGAGGKVPGPEIPTIVFHGDADATVHPRNGDAVMSQMAGAAAGRARAETGHVPGGRSYTRTVLTDARDRTIAEHWVIRGAPHAWSGGCPGGSYTDPAGPDASAEMVRFFMAVTPRQSRVLRIS